MLTLFITLSAWARSTLVITFSRIDFIYFVLLFLTLKIHKTIALICLNSSRLSKVCTYILEFLSSPLVICLYLCFKPGLVWKCKVTNNIYKGLIYIYVCSRLYGLLFIVYLKILVRRARIIVHSHTYLRSFIILYSVSNYKYNKSE